MVGHCQNIILMSILLACICKDSPMALILFQLDDFANTSHKNTLKPLQHISALITFNCRQDGDIRYGTC